MVPRANLVLRLKIFLTTATDVQTYTIAHSPLSNECFGFHEGRTRESQFHSFEFARGPQGSSDSSVPPLFPLSPLDQATTLFTSLSLTITTSNSPHNTTTFPDKNIDNIPVEEKKSPGPTANSELEALRLHDSFRFTSGGNPRLGDPPKDQETLPQLLNSDGIAIQQSTLPPEGLTMGLNNNSQSNERLQQQRTVSTPKMEENNQSTGVTNMGEYSRTNERKDHEDDSTTAHSMDSSVPSPSLSARGDHPTAEPLPLGVHSVVTTPSTVSTAPSTTDEASLMLDPSHLDRLALRYDGTETVGLRHRRMPSWESHTLPAAAIEPSRDSTHLMAPGGHPPHPSTPNVWSNPQAHARIASFRNESDSSRYGFRPPEAMWHQHGNLGNQVAPGAVYRLPQQQQSASPFSAYPARNTPQTHPPLPPTPPRGSTRAHQRVPQSPHRSGTSYSGNQPSSGSGPGSRSSAEVLKTLLRKKACLYEPDTSRAVALVTWLVGRELALEFGFFSRQQLQAGVHACVADKIDSGVITRTKVNRCMQIILNSCFHYIIPRPDGSEENGEIFRLMFAREVTDDTPLLRELPSPWNDLTVSSDVVLAAALSEVKSPQSSPALESMGNPAKDSKEHDDQDNDNKKAVLLCFNENVRCAEDVFRCHNEFIRDTAHACHLQLSSFEWRHFFGAEAASAPHLWGNIGIPLPANEMCDPGQVDALGMMSINELSKFRTFWCTKRYEHDHELCGFAHIEVNGGWLRRDPSHYNYRAEMCQFVKRQPGTLGSSKVLIVNECPHGMYCEYAHSAEEVVYHPMRYKRRVCHATHRHPGICHNGDACPDFHAMETYRFPSKKIDGRAGSRHARHTGTGKTPAPPSGSPILYASPAPPSRFEDHLVLPGLKNLYRRHSSVMRAHIHQGGQCVCSYANFGDDTGVAADHTGASCVQKPRGLPSVPH